MKGEMNMKRLSLLIPLLSFVLVIGTAFGVDGDLDTTFGGGTGIVTVDISGGSSADIGSKIAVQADGKLVVIGNSDALAAGAAVIRFNTDGTLDTTFGTAGVASVAPIVMNIARDLVIQPDGKIVVVGENGSTIGAIVRFNTNGSVDAAALAPTTSFPDSSYRGVALLDDGSIIVTGEATPGASGDILLGKYLAEPPVATPATLVADPTFGTAGFTTQDPSGSQDRGNAVAIQSDGRIVVAGGIDIVGVGGSNVVARFLASGALDTGTFNPSGTNPGFSVFGGTSSGNEATGIAIQANGKIVVSGNDAGIGGGDFILSRFNPDDGSTDLTFGVAGLTTVDISGSTLANFSNDLVLQSDGKIIAVGQTFDGVDQQFGILKLTQNGTPDPQFNPQAMSLTMGIQIIDATPLSSNDAQGVAVQSDGKIVVSGTSAQNGSDFVVIRLQNTIEATPGSYDSTFNDEVFGNLGKVLNNQGATDIVFNDVAVQSNGQIVAVGTYDASTAADMVVARYELGGGIDSTFGTFIPGITIIDSSLGSGTSFQDTGNAVAIQPDGKIIVVGQSDATTPTGDFFIARLNTNGTLDASFDDDGEVFCNFGNPDDIARAVGLQSDGKIVVAGSTGAGAMTDFAMTRINTDGSLDSGFGTVTEAGKVILDVSSDSDQCNDLKILSDDKILLAGTVGAISDFAVARFTKEGILDTTFNSAGTIPGVFTRGSAVAFSDSCNAVDVQSDGKIILVGDNGTDIVVMRILADGSGIDPTFNASGTNPGILVFPLNNVISTLSNAGRDVVVQSDDKILIAGNYDTGTKSDAFVVRLNVDGTFDTTFGTNGFKVSNCGSNGPVSAIAGDRGNRMALKSDGTIVVAGGSGNNGLLIQLNNNVNAVTSTLTIKKVFCFGDCGTFVTGCRNGHRVLIEQDRAGNIVESPILSKCDFMGTTTNKVDKSLFATLTADCPASITC